MLVRILAWCGVREDWAEWCPTDLRVLLKWYSFFCKDKRERAKSTESGFKGLESRGLLAFSVPSPRLHLILIESLRKSLVSLKLPSTPPCPWEGILSAHLVYKPLQAGAAHLQLSFAPPCSHRPLIPKLYLCCLPISHPHTPAPSAPSRPSHSPSSEPMPGHRR